ncbi:MAG TPA: trypsin-like peptidase domain-containing protein [Gemmatimonadaceae bacterium]|jgi:serine protease Do|nr:trypsin-like peptidase domain-containing protein [Gemmatimonadaceae bacterium]
MKGRRRMALAITFVVGCQNSAPSDAQSARQDGGTPARVTPAMVPAARRTPITDAVAKVAPAVVTVQTEMVERVPADPFEMFFGGRSGQRRVPGLGSGFIVRADGVIVTNAHVVSGASRVSVALRDGTTYDAKVLGADEANDLAVLKIDARDLPVAEMGDSNGALIGEWVIAIGNPFGFLLGNTEPSVTTGVLSATGRNLVGQGDGGAGGAYVDMLQTDASINPGNSGGPLVNALGEVIGVNSSIYSPTGGSVGLGFAIPINRARRVTEDLLEHGAVRRAWIGVKLEVPEASVAAREALTAGAVVRSVVPGSPAARAGIRPQDVLVRSRNRPLRNWYDWEAELLELRVGEEVPLVVRRGGGERTVTVKVADLPEVNAPKVQVLRELELATLTPAIRAERQTRTVRGALVTGATPRVSDQLGILVGDVILQVNRTAVGSAEDVVRALDYYGGRGPITMLVERNQRIYRTDFIIR